MSTKADRDPPIDAHPPAQLRAAAVAVCVALAGVLTGLIPLSPEPAHAAESVTYTYRVAVKGVVRSDVNDFAAHAAATLADPRGWSLGGSIRFVQVDSGGDFTLWLAEADLMSTFSSECDSTYSCRVGRDVIINDDRWAGGSAALNMGLEDYRHMVVSHEVGHWLGGPHFDCPAPGQPAFIMQQQSKGDAGLDGCLPNPWPRPEERMALAQSRGVAIIEAPLRLGMASTPTGQGYWVVQSDGKVYAKGDATDFGSMLGQPLNRPLVGIAATRTGRGYWLVAEDGGIFSFGDARFFGSTGNIALNRPVVGMTSTPTGQGYWFVASDGGIFAYGDAAFFGSTGAMHLNEPIVGMAATPSGHGYWLVAADGGIFSFGDAGFFGSTGAMKLNKPVAGMTASPTGQGYRFVASDGGIFSFGDAVFFGSLGGAPPSHPVVAMTATPTGGGYWMLGSDGTVFNFGDAPFAGDAT